MKFAMKRLTASDLTLFEWQFRHANAGNQKAINLNADVFVDQLFPALRDTTPASFKLPVDLFVYGPDGHNAVNLQRKIVSGAAYKNWRLNGELIHNPDVRPDRFNGLKPDDVAVFAFDGTPLPHTLHLVLVSARTEAALHHLLASQFVGASSMIALDETQFEAILKHATVPEDHVLHALAVGADLEDIAAGVAEPRARAARRQGRPVDREQLAKGREAAALVGRVGEELVRAWLQAEKEAGRIESYEWVSDTNAVAPFDFSLVKHRAGRCIEVKATSGTAARAFPISMAEIEAAAASLEPYDIVRVSDVNVVDPSGNIHCCEDIRHYAKQIVAFARAAPHGCAIDAVSIDPSVIGMQFVRAFAVPR